MVESPPALALVLVQHESMANNGGALGEGKDAEKDKRGLPAMKTNFVLLQTVVWAKLVGIWANEFSFTHMSKGFDWSKTDHSQTWGNIIVLPPCLLWNFPFFTLWVIERSLKSGLWKKKKKLLFKTSEFLSRMFTEHQEYVFCISE